MWRWNERHGRFQPPLRRPHLRHGGAHTVHQGGGHERHCASACATGSRDADLVEPGQDRIDWIEGVDPSYVAIEGVDPGHDRIEGGDAGYDWIEGVDPRDDGSKSVDSNYDWIQGVNSGDDWSEAGDSCYDWIQGVESGYYGSKGFDPGDDRTEGARGCAAHPATGGGHPGQEQEDATIGESPSATASAGRRSPILSAFCF